MRDSHESAIVCKTEQKIDCLEKTWRKGSGSREKGSDSRSPTKLRCFLSILLYLNSSLSFVQ